MCQPERKRREAPRSILTPLIYIYIFFSSLFSYPEPALCKLGQPGVLFVPPGVLTPVFRPSFVLFSRAFPFLVFQPPPFWTPFPYSNYLTFPPQEMRGPILWEQGRRGLSGYFLLNWDGEGYWASPSCQSQASESLWRCPSKGKCYFPWSAVVLYILVELALYVVAC